MHISFIGGGNIAEAILKGLLKAGHAADALTVADPTETRRISLRDQFGINVESDNARAVNVGDLVILAVKPGVILEICKEVAPFISGRVVVSVAAGVRSSSILKILGQDARLVRVMPNTPALVGEGMSALAKTGQATDSDLQAVRKIFDTVGRTVTVTEELMDAVTGLSGSGPAYVFVVIEAMADGGVKAGLPRAEAQLLAAQTVLGAARMVLETGVHPGKLKDMVASPGGTTIEGLSALEDAGIRGALIEAVWAASRKSEALGNG